MPYGSNFAPISDFLSVAEKTGQCLGFLGSGGCSLEHVAIVERLNKRVMCELSARTKKVAVVERWLLVDWFDCTTFHF